MTTISWLGCGNMAGALLRALLIVRSKPASCPSDFVKSIKNILIYDPVFTNSPEQRKKLHDELNTLSNNSVEITFVQSATEAAERCEVGIIGVKPQFSEEALLPVRGHWGAKSKSSKSDDQPTIIVSMLAGTSIASLEKLLVDPELLLRKHQQPTRLVVARLMPNIGSQVRHGASGYSIDAFNISRATNGKENEHAVTNYAKEVVEGLFGCAGFISFVPEKFMNAITAMQGIPAWITLFIESAADGGVSCGLPRPLAKRFAAEIVFGSAALLAGDKPAFSSTLALKEAVSSPAGTTIRGIGALEDRGFRSAVINAVIAANSRADELKKMGESGRDDNDKNENGTSRMSKL